jgi:hypothetical protein
MRYLLTIILSAVCLVINASNLQYTKYDSIKVVELLNLGRHVSNKNDLSIFFARKLINVPYVAHTLDNNAEEKLVINLRQLDCTTYVENVLALSICCKSHLYTFHDFCNILSKVRYESGNIKYTSRLHYFTEWIESNQRQGNVEKIEKQSAPFNNIQHVKANYMTTHSDSYDMLKNNANRIKGIKEMENRITGRNYRYISKSNIINSKLMRQTIHSGDIIAILTNKPGLDTSHIGIAVWHKDGLHLLNASSIHKKVVEETMTLHDYMIKHPSQIGIRVVRPK